MRRWLLGIVLVTACSDAGPSFRANCIAGVPGADAKLGAGPQPDGSVILPGGRLLTPAGRTLTIGGFPLALRVLPAAGARAADRWAVVTDAAVGNESLRLVDLQATDPALAVVAHRDYPQRTGSSQDLGLFYGLALTNDGARIYVSDGGYDGAPDSEPDLTKHFNVVEVFTLSNDATPTMTRLDSEEIDLHFHGSTAGAAQRFPAGLQLSADEKTLYVVNQFDGTMSIVDLHPGAGYGAELGTTPELGLAPYTVFVDEPAQRAYVSLWGGLMMGGTFVEGIQPIDISNPLAPMPVGLPITTGKAPEAIIAAGGSLYVTAADADSIAVVDRAAKTSQSYPTGLDATALGSTPNDLVVDATRGRLYVANAGENAVQAFDLTTMKSLGRLPVGWYPTAVVLLSDGTLVVANGKGLGGGPTDRSPGDNGLMAGVLEIIPPPSDADLTAGDTLVRANLDRPHTLEVALTCTGTPKRFPLPPSDLVERAAATPSTTPIEHVFLVVRENKTYDAVLGDLEGANGRADLAIFGGDITPNLHALARRFANLDNFYSNAEQSIQGHEWTTSDVSNDYVEKTWLTSWGRATRPLSAYSSLGNGLDHLALPQSKTIFTLLDAANVAYHNYGEAVNIGGAKVGLDTNYPGVFFGLLIPDVNKVAYIISNIQDPTFKLEPLSYIGLPNDHTKGTSPGAPTPQSMIADNDEATGRLVDALSHSSYWKSSVVIVIEDDPSDGGDHVELHRSPCVVMSPWVKRGYTSSGHYDYPSMWRTITLLLGVGPLNAYDAHAAAMYDLFSPTPDLEPYVFIPRKVPMATNSVDAPLGDESARIDFSRPDQAPLGRILWKAMRGKDAEPPWGVKPVGFARDDDD